ncbi:MAG: hypothetical protein WAN92_09305 [Herbaspirillum sp.]
MVFFYEMRLYRFWQDGDKRVDCKTPVKKLHRRPGQAIPDCGGRQRERVIPFFASPPEVCKIIYTTNAIESMRMQLRKIIRNCGVRKMILNRL